MSEMLLAIVGGGAALLYMRERRLPNWLTLGGALLAAVLAFSQAGWHGLADSVGGCFTAIAMLAPLALVRLAAPGDLKLIGAMGACAGLGSIGWLGITLVLVALATALGRTLLQGTLLRLATWCTTTVGLIRLGAAWRVHVLGPAPGRIPLAYVLSAAALMFSVVSLAR